MANCEHPYGCAERATKILSVGSLGRVESLCERHIAESVRQLEPNLVPFHLTGIDAPFSGEQSLQERVGVLDTAAKDLRGDLEDARHENTRLRELLLARLEEQNEDLRAELDELRAENARLADTVREPTPASSTAAVVD